MTKIKTLTKIVIKLIPIIKTLIPIIKTLLPIIKTLIPIMFITFTSSITYAEEETFPLEKANVDVSDFASLQRGAELFMNYCSGCHSLRFVRYSGLAKDIGIVNSKGDILEDLVKKDLMFSSEKITDPILSALTKEEGTKWFGMAPPDLSLVSRSRGPDWLYTYLLSFYKDSTKPWGVNNMVFPSVSMPHVLVSLQGVQIREGDRLTLQQKGSLKPEEYERAVLDIVNFLTYVGEPHQQERKHMGVFVLIFLGVFLVFAWLLKREYWKDVPH